MANVLSYSEAVASVNRAQADQRERSLLRERVEKLGGDFPLVLDLMDVFEKAAWEVVTKVVGEGETGLKDALNAYEALAVSRGSLATAIAFAESDKLGTPKSTVQSKKKRSNKRTRRG